MAEKTTKRKYTAIDLDIKLKALNEMNQGSISNDVIAKDLGVHVSTVKSWVKNEQKLKQLLDENNNHMPKGRKRLRKPDFEIVDKAMWIWFCERRAAGCPLSGSLIKTQAMNFWKGVGGGREFNASQGWLTKWKLRHGIRCVVMAGEKNSADHAAAKDFKDKFPNFIQEESLTPDQMFNCDETGLNFRQLPKRTLGAKSEKDASGWKLQKERLTVMACSNASGTFKLPLVVIGKSVRPRAIKNLVNLPVYYRAQKSAWMTGGLFENWFHDEFVPKVTGFLLQRGLPPKAILFVDNCGAHPQNLMKGDIRVHFFPKNTTSLIQPMDQGCLQHLKTLYRQSLMTFILDKLNGGSHLAEALKSLTIRDVIFWVADAWSSLPKSTIINSWKPVWPQIVEKATCNTNDSHPSESIQSSAGDNLLDTNGNSRQEHPLVGQFFVSLREEEDFGEMDFSSIEEWLNPGKSQTEDECLNENEILEVVLAEQSTNKENTEPDTSKNETKTSIADLRFYLDTVIEHCEQSIHYNKDQVLALHNVRETMKIESLLPQPLSSN